MSVAVVHFLETIEVDLQQSQLRGRLRRWKEEHRTEARVQSASIQQSCQRVLTRQFLRRQLILLSVSYVVDDALERGRTDRIQGDLDPHRARDPCQCHVEIEVIGLTGAQTLIQELVETRAMRPQQLLKRRDSRLWQLPRCQV